MSDPEPLGPWLRAARKARGLSVSGAGHDIGCGVNTLGTWERGQLPSVRWAPAIARAYGIDEDDLVERMAHAREARRMRGARVLDRVDAETGMPLGPDDPPILPRPAEEPRPW